MDNLCHSLAGAAIAQAGFARRLPRATLLAIVAANIPDVDALVYLGSDQAFAVSFRRGWTHGLPALMVWTLALAATLSWWNRIRPAILPGGDRPGRFGVRAFVPLAALCVASHPLLDLMNTYGVRLLMPLSDRWFYGDTLFIVDPPLLVMLGLGAVISSRALRAAKPWSEVPARGAIALALAYIAAMNVMSVVTERMVVRELAIADPSARTIMVAPRPLAMFSREVVVSRGGRYERSLAGWAGLTPALSKADRWSEPTGADAATVAAVQSTIQGERFLRWARFPYFAPGAGADSGTIFVGDARYSSGTDESWAGLRVRPHAPEAPASR